MTYFLNEILLCLVIYSKIFLSFLYIVFTTLQSQIINASRL